MSSILNITMVFSFFYYEIEEINILVKYLMQDLQTVFKKLFPDYTMYLIAKFRV